MNTTELLLKTVFACMACDGDIAPEEIQLVRDLTNTSNLFHEIDVETVLNGYIDSINQNGVNFLRQYLNDITESELTIEDQLCLVDLAIRTIEADNIIKYSEVKFFKKIRVRLSLTDEEILLRHPDKEDFLLPDTKVVELPDWNNVTFAPIQFNANLSDN